MGIYATTTSIDTFTIGVTFDSATTSLVTSCISWAENEINRSLAKHFDVSSWQTSGSVPPEITSIAEQLTLGYFYQTQSRGGEEGRERAKEFLNMARDPLKELANGKRSLVNTAGAAISRRSSAKGVLSNTKDYAPTFAEDRPLNWAVDTDKLDDISDDRE